MSKEIKDKAKEYLKAQLSVIPTKEDKLPALTTWKPYQSQRLREDEVEALFSGENVKGLAIICGTISGGLEVIDVDTKHDTTGSLWDELSILIRDNLPELYNRLVIAQTKSGGYHIYYRCSSIAGNLKLAIKLNREVLIETRGEGGYVIAPPTPKYTYIQGEPGNIPTINTEDRDILFSIAKSFNELEEVKPKISTTSSTTYNSTGLSPFEDYNQRGDLVALLESRGWKVVNQRGQRVNLLRPGSTDSKTSGNYHTGLRVLRVFSSSTEFNPDKGYSPSQVFSLLECKGDNKLTYRRLLELGYGEPYKGENITPTQVKTELIKVEVVNQINRETSIISTPGESLKIENIQTAIGEEIVITSPGSQAQEEILKAIDLIQETGKRIYIKEGGKELRDYTYQLQYIFNKYGTIEEESGGLTDRDKHNLLDEVVILSTKLQSIDKDVFLKKFIDEEPIKKLGISEEAMAITRERLTTTRDKEAQSKEFNKLLSEATKLQDKGQTAKALELLESKVKEVKLKDKATEFSKFLEIPTEQSIKKIIQGEPDSLPSGYTLIDGIGTAQALELPSGALSIIAARTSHRKTSLMMNMAINISQSDKEGEIYFFSYEESREAILLKLMNIYIDKDFKQGENNLKYIKGYFKHPTGANYHNTDFINGKDKFFKDLINTGKLRVNYSSLESSSLCKTIEQIKEKAKPIAIFIDYIQLLRAEGKYQSKQIELQAICERLRETAITTGLPIILGAQFNRDANQEGNIDSGKIREAGDIEQTADLVLGLWDRKFTKQDGTHKNRKGEQAIFDPGTLYVEVLKGRSLGAGAYGELPYKGNTWKINNYSSSDPFKGNSYKDRQLMKRIKDWIEKAGLLDDGIKHTLKQEEYDIEDDRLNKLIKEVRDSIEKNKPF